MCNFFSQYVIKKIYYTFVHSEYSHVYPANFLGLNSKVISVNLINIYIESINL